MLPARPDARMIYDTNRNSVLLFGGVQTADSGGRYSNETWQYRCPFELNVFASCPNAGWIQINWSRGTPNAQVALLYARNEGSFVIPNGNPCAGTALGLGTQQLKLAWTGHSDADGSGTLNAMAPAGACGGYLQMLDAATCIASNVVQIE